MDKCIHNAYIMTNGFLNNISILDVRKTEWFYSAFWMCFMIIFTYTQPLEAIFNI